MNDNFNTLTIDQHKAILMRLEGKPYPIISKSIGKSVSTIEKWFFRGGVCFSTFQEQKDKQKELMQDEIESAEIAIKKMIPHAIRTLEQHVLGGSLKAALAVISLADLTPPQKIKDVTGDETLSTLEVLKDIFVKNGRHRQTNKPIQGEGATSEPIADAEGDI